MAWEYFRRLGKQQLKDTDIIATKTESFEDGRPFCLGCFEWCDVYGNMLSGCCKCEHYLTFEELTKEERIEMFRYCNNKE